MNPDLSMVLSLRRVLESAQKGMGMSQSLVKELGAVRPTGAYSARRLLLGFPLAVALQPLMESGSEEVGMLASLIVSTPRSSALLVGQSGEELARTLENWVKLKENRRLEQRVLSFRGVITSGVLGAVTAMVATLGPVVGSLSFTTTAAPGTSNFLPAAAAMTGVSSGMLGLFMSGRRMFVNVAVAMAVFAAVSLLASPLANVPSFTMWGVK